MFRRILMSLMLAVSVVTSIGNVTMAGASDAYVNHFRYRVAFVLQQTCAGEPIHFYEGTGNVLNVITANGNITYRVNYVLWGTGLVTGRSYHEVPTVLFHQIDQGAYIFMLSDQFTIAGTNVWFRYVGTPSGEVSFDFTSDPTCR